jgi:type II secretory pathway pseudopilin PulG
MEYIRLSNLPNQYPDAEKYTTNTEGDIVLTGNLMSDKEFIRAYKESNGNLDMTNYKPNSITFVMPKLDDITTVDVVSNYTKFIIAVYIDEDDTSPKYFATTPFFRRLQTSLKESNPYFVSYALQDEYVVKYYLSQVQKTFQNLVPLEARDGVKFKQNNFLVWDGDTKDALGKPKTTVDYEALVQFINWCLTPPNPNDVDGVWPISKLTEFEFGIADKDGNFIPRGKYDNMNKIQDLRDELVGIETEILQIQTELKNPAYARLNLGSIIAGGIGAAGTAAGLGILGGSLGAFGALVTTTTTTALTGGIGTALGIAATTTTAATGLGTAATILGAVGGPIGIGVAAIIGLGIALWSSSSKKEAQNKRVEEVARQLIARLSLVTARKQEILKQIAEIEANINKPTTSSAGVRVTNTTNKTSTSTSTASTTSTTSTTSTGGTTTSNNNTDSMATTGARTSGNAGSARQEQLYGGYGGYTASGTSTSNMR